MKSVHTRPGEENSENNIAKKFKKLKNHFSTLFLAKSGCDSVKKREKLLVLNSVHTRPEEENSKENSENNNKKFKKLKNLIPALFLAKTG